jgi:hypothetical protein
MRYTRFELGFTRSRKVNALDDAAFRLWISLIDYSREQITDGHVLPLDLNTIPHCPTDSKTRSELVNQLIQNGLLDSKSDGSWQIHDFLDWQDSKEYIKERRVYAKQKAKSARGSRIQKSNLDLDLEKQKLFPENSLFSSSLNLDPKSSSEIRSEDPESAPRTREQELRIVFDFWAKEMNHPNSKLGADRKRRINARMEEGFTVRDLCLAIKGAKSDDWYMGRAPNSNTSYDGIHNLFLNSERVEKFIELSGKKRTSGGAIVQQTQEQALKAKSDHDAAVERDRERQRKKLSENSKKKNIGQTAGQFNIIDALKGTI